MTGVRTEDGRDELRGVRTIEERDAGSVQWQYKWQSGSEGLQVGGVALRNGCFGAVLVRIRSLGAGGTSAALAGGC